MRRNSKRLLAMLLTLVMCFATVTPTMVFAEDTNSRIVTMEDFNGDSINTASDVVSVSQNGGFWFDTSREGGTHSLENDTLWYTCRRGQLIDIRFYHEDYLDTSKENNKTAVDNMADIVSKLEGQDFILSFRLKAHHDAISMKSTFTEHYRDAAGTIQDETDDASMQISDGTINSHTEKSYTGEDGITIKTVANLDYEILNGKWYVIEIAFDYDATATSHTGETGAYTHANLMFNGQVIERVKLEYNFNRIDMIRLGQGSVDECEIDDIAVATGLETLAEEGDFDPYVKRTRWIKAADKTPASNYAYSFAVVGDTQKVSRIDAINIYNNSTGGNYDITKGNQMDQIYKWIVDNVDSKKIEYVLGLGDITEYGYGETLAEGNKYSDIEWANAVAAISQMNGVVPYSITRGNHDGLNAGVNKYFTDDYKSQFSANTDAAGFFGNQGVANSYRAVTIGQTNYLFVTLNYNPTDAVLEEAGKVIEQYPNHKVVITTHAYMYDNYTTISAEDYSSGYGNNDGEGIWNKLIRKYENICLVMSGHIGSDLVQVSQVTGDHGNTITQMLIDFQVTDAHYGYTGMVVMLYFSTDGNQIEVETYSPLHNAYFLEENQFTVKLEPNAIYSNEFNSLDGISLTTVGSGILGLQNYGYALLDNGVLKLTESTSASDCILGFRPFQGGDAIKNMTYDGDVRLSFRVKMDEAINLGQFTVRDQLTDKNTSELFMKLAGKNVQVDHDHDGTYTNYGTMLVGDWNEFHLVFHLDGTTKQYDEFTIVLNGKVLGTFAFADATNFVRLDRFELFRYASNGKSFELDSMYYGFSDDIGQFLNGEKLWGVDFEGVTTVPTKAEAATNYFRVMNGYLNSYSTPGASTVGNGVLHLVTGGAQSFVDAKYNYDLGYNGTFTVSARFRPLGERMGTPLMQLKGWKKADGSAGSDLQVVKCSGSSLNFNGKNVATLSMYRFSTVEIMFNYDYANGIYSSVDLYVNGVCVGSMDISNEGYAAMGYFRMFYYGASSANKGYGFDIDEMSIVTGNTSRYVEDKTEFIGYQTTKVDENDRFNLRLVSIMTDADVSKYDYVGYNVTASFTYNGQLVTMEMPAEIRRCNKVFTAILATDAMDVEDEVTASALGGQYIFAVNCMGLPADCDITFNVTTCYKLVGAESEVAERGYTFTVNSASNASQGGVN